MSKFAFPSDATGRIATPFPLSLYQGLLKEIKSEKPPNNFNIYSKIVTYAPVLCDCMLHIINPCR